MPQAVVDVSTQLFPRIDAEVFQTKIGTPYLVEPGVVMIAKPNVSLAGLSNFFAGFGAELKFIDYLADPTTLPPGATLCKFGGQMCYVACGEGRTWNKDAIKYFRNIMDQKHGSVLEHAVYSLQLYGISRSVTHELVRHRAGFGFSQVSQRYVDGKVLRFVMRPEFFGDVELESEFCEDIDRAAAKYARRTAILLARQEQGGEMLSRGQKRDRRKKVQQAARSVLPNETEAPILVTANARAWRHFLEMRASEHAEVEIRRVAMRIYDCLVAVEPIIFGDYQEVKLADGTRGLTNQFIKV